jgi:hypothetical protein
MLVQWHLSTESQSTAACSNGTCAAAGQLGPRACLLSLHSRQGPAIPCLLWVQNTLYNLQAVP